MGKPIVKLVIMPFLVVMFILSFVAPALNTAATNYVGQQLADTLIWLQNQGYVAWAANGLSANEVAYATSGNTLEGESSFTYNPSTNVLDVDAIFSPTGRTTTVVIVAYDATDQAKEQADYILTGSNDQNTINQVISSNITTDNTAKVIQLTEGTFNISSSPILFANANTWGSTQRMWFRGVGYATRINVVTDNTVGIQVGTAANTAAELYLSDFSLIGSGGNNPDNESSIGIRLVNAVRTFYNNIKIRNFSEWGISVDYNHSNYFSNIILRSNGIGGSDTGGIRVGDDNPANMTSFTRIALDPNNGTAIQINRGSGIYFSDLIIESSYYYAIDVDQVEGSGIVFDKVLLENNNQSDTLNTVIRLSRVNGFISIKNVVGTNMRASVSYSITAHRNVSNLMLENITLDKPTSLANIGGYIRNASGMSTVAPYPSANYDVNDYNLMGKIGLLSSLAQGLELYWSFTEGSGQDIGDLSGNGMRGVQNNTNYQSWEKTTSNRTSYKMTNDSSTVYINRNLINFHGDRSFVLAFVTGWNYNQNAQIKRLLNWGSGNNRVELYDDTDNDLVYKVTGGGNSANVTYTLQLATGDPVVLVGIIDDDNDSISIYANNILLGTDSGIGDVSPATATLRLGADGSDYGWKNNQYVTFAVYAKILNKEEIGSVTRSLLAEMTGGLISNSGTATISNGNSSVNVTHSLVSTPTYIQLTGTHSEVSNVIATSLDSTQFTITANSSVTSDREVYWKAVVGSE